MKTPLTLIAATVLTVALTSCGKEDDASKQGGDSMKKPQPVEVMPVEVMRMQESTGLVGSIAANESAELRAEYPGTVDAIQFEEGQEVSKGQVLIQLDTRETKALLAEARANFQLALKTLERNRKLLADQAVSQLEVDAAEAEHARLKAVIDRLEVQVEKASITAPFNGVVGGRSISVGDYVSSQAVITTVDDLSRLKVEMEVPERYLPLLSPGSSFTLEVATSRDDESISGEVYFVSPRIDEQTRASMVKGLIVEPPPYLKPGMFADITLILRTVEEAMVVPEAAVLGTPRGTVLVKPVEKDGVMVAEFVPVRLGIRVPGRVQVIPVGPPIKPGDKIVSAGVGGLILFPGRELKMVNPMVGPEQPEQTDRKLH